MNERVTQTEEVIRNGVVPEWFHGTISRKASEELLMCKPPGYFLIRDSESRIGYTLSYRAEDGCRHFMINVSKDGYIILGDDKHHRLLEDLVDFHRKFPIQPFSELLTLPCGRISDFNTDFEELLFPEQSLSPNSLQSHIQKNMPVPDVAPVLPFRLGSMMDSAAEPFNVQPSRLYPSLDLFYNAIPCDLPQTVPDSRAPTTANTPTPNQPPELPSRNVKPFCKKNLLGNRTNCALPSLSKDHKEPFDSLTSVVSKLKKFKKKLHRKSNSSEQPVYEDVAVKEEVKAETEYHEIVDHQIIQAEQNPYSCIRAELPLEYLPPPPFAPGYT